MNKITKSLLNVDPTLIVKNPDNPRLIFREDELDALMRSIEKVGIQVPLSVYKKGEKYVLIDGERRWRSSTKLGLQLVPIIVEPEPSPLENLLMMFNIHNVRVHWDLMALALKVSKVKELAKKERRVDLSKKELADLLGINTATIARCEELMALPQKYQDIIWNELQKPKGEQKYTEDLFIEIKKSIKAIDSHLPEVTAIYNPPKLLDIFYKKYETGVENNRVKFRELSKIARASNVGIDKERIVKTLKRYFTEPKYTIDEAFKASAAEAYEDRNVEKKLTDAYNLLVDLHPKDIDNKTGKLLKKIASRIDELMN